MIWVESSVDDALFSGNPEGIAAWRAAINARRELGAQFQGGDLAQKLTARAPRGGEMQLKVAPEDAANFIFGASATGWTTKSNLARDLTRIRDMLGADSAGWNALRQEAFLRLSRTAEGAFEGGERQLWARTSRKPGRRCSATVPRSSICCSTKASGG